MSQGLKRPCQLLPGNLGREAGAGGQPNTCQVTFQQLPAERACLPAVSWFEPSLNFTQRSPDCLLGSGRHELILCKVFTFPASRGRAQVAVDARVSVERWQAPSVTEGSGNGSVPQKLMQKWNSSPRLFRCKGFCNLYTQGLFAKLVQNASDEKKDPWMSSCLAPE